VLSFTNVEDELKAKIASTAAGQIIGEVLDITESSNNSPNNRDIDLSFSMMSDSSVVFDNLIHKVVCPVMRDSLAVACGQRIMRLRVPSMSTGVRSAIFEGIVVHHAPLLSTSPHFRNLIGTLFKAHSSVCPLVLRPVRQHLYRVAGECLDLLLHRPHARSAAANANFLHGSLFLRVFLLQKSHITMRFDLNCDLNARLLIAALRSIAERSINDQINISIAIAYPFATSVEIAIFFVQSCYGTQNIALKVFVSQALS
jgi:hypothetical protein